MTSFRCRAPAPAWRPFTAAVNFPHHALFAAAICADVVNDRGFGAAHSASDFAAEDFARSTGDLPPALGAGMITRAPSRKPSTTTPSPTDTPELTAAIGPSVGPILTGRTDTPLSALMT